MKFKLSPGTWHWGLRNKETKKPVRYMQYVPYTLLEETDIDIEIPEHLQSPDNEIYVERVR